MPIRGKGQVMGETGRRICAVLDRRGALAQVNLREQLMMTPDMYAHAIRSLRQGGYIVSVDPAHHMIARTTKELPRRVLRRKRATPGERPDPYHDWVKADPVTEAAMRAMIRPPAEVAAP